MLACRVIPSFLASAKRNGFSELSDQSLRIWVADMMLNGLKHTTCVRYLGSMHMAYRAWRDDASDADDPFTALKESLGHAEYECRHKEAQSNLRLVTRMLKMAGNTSDRLTVNIILYLLYNVKASIADVIALRRSDAGIDCQQIDDIIEAANSAPNSKYVFALRQGKKRESQIARELISEMHATLKAVGMSFDGVFSRDSITAMWIAAALNCGVSIEYARAMVEAIPREYSFLSLIRPVALNAAVESAIIKKVADSINDKTSRWFVMKLRNGKRPDDIRNLLERRNEKMLGELTLYYPTRKVVRREAKKVVREEVPYLPDLLFFRMRADRVGRLFSLIGELAWCYRVTNSPDSPYCTIPPAEMRKFQMHIGRLTSDIEMELVTTRPAINVGDSVRITGGGLLEGKEGIVQRIRDTNGTVSYSLMLSESTSIIWKDIQVKDTFVEPVRQK